MTNFYSSRSATDCFDHCDRHRFLEYHFMGRGLTLKAVNFPLAVGTDVHIAIALILGAIKEIGKEKFVNENADGVIESAITLCLHRYDERIQKLAYFDNNRNLTQRELHFTYAEQRALMEALIRAWSWIELPRILQRYEILEVEREYVQRMDWSIEPRTVDTLFYQGTPDALLQDITTRDCVVYSLKTAKQYNERTEKGFSHDLQGITETWLVEQEMKMRNAAAINAAKALQSTQVKGWQDIVTWLGGKQWPTSITGQQMCILVKGERRKKHDDSYVYDENAIDEQENKPAEKYTNSPLIRGYRKHNPDGTIYAHSDKRVEPKNKSGFGKLGKGWEPFNVWEDEQIGGIKNWMAMLASGQIQPDLGDILRSKVITPPEYFRSGMDLDGTINEVMAKERRVIQGIKNVEDRLGLKLDEIKNLSDPQVLTVLQDEFPRCRRGCHYPQDCAYLHVCFNRKVAANPLNHGQEGVPVYELRTPHHEAELKSLEKGE